MCSMSFFHYSEYLVTAIINPRSLSLDSFLLNHSVEYTVAAVSSWVEFTIEKLSVPGLASYHTCAQWLRSSLTTLLALNCINQWLRTTSSTFLLGTRLHMMWLDDM